MEMRPSFVIVEKRKSNTYEVKLMVSPPGGVRFTATANGLQQKKGLSNYYFSCPIRTVIALYYVKLMISPGRGMANKSLPIVGSVGARLRKNIKRNRLYGFH